MTVTFEVDGQQFLALNGGPNFTFSEAISFEIACADQKEVDHYWNGLVADGGEHGPCGWLKDRFGVSWQVVPQRLTELIGDGSGERAQRVMAAMMTWGSSTSQSSRPPRRADSVPCRRISAPRYEGDRTRGLD